MTDRAIVPSSVPKFYVGIYEQIEDEQHPEPVALELASCIESDVKKEGRVARKLIDTIVPLLKHLSASLFRGSADFKYEIFQKIRAEESKASDDRLHVECAADACRHICNMLDNEDMVDISSEINIQYRLNICDARLDQIESELPEEKKERFLRDNILTTYEKSLRNPRNHAQPKGNKDLLNINIIKKMSDL